MMTIKRMFTKSNKNKTTAVEDSFNEHEETSPQGFDHTDMGEMEDEEEVRYIVIYLYTCVHCNIRYNLVHCITINVYMYM